MSSYIKVRLPALVTFVFVILLGFTQNADAARGRPRVNAAGTTFVSDSNTLLRGPQTATESGTVLLNGSYLNSLKSYGCNAIHCYAETHAGGYAAGTRAVQVDQVVAMTATAGFYVIITVGSGGVQADFNKAFWEFYAKRYANQTHVIYEIQNEITSGAPSSAAVITEERTAYDIIRANAPDTPVLFFSYQVFNSGSNVVKDAQALGSDIDWTKAGIAFHGYGSYGRIACRTTMDYVVKAGYPIFQTEFYRWPWGKGDFSLTSGDAMYQDVGETGDCERLGVSWLSFLTPGYTLNDARYKTLLKNGGVLWKPDFGSWPTVSGSAVFIGRGAYSSDGEPWTQRNLADKVHIEAEDFDYGGEGVAYHDSDSVNSGGMYRTDERVDISTCLDTNGGYHVGYIQSGEWLEYTTFINNAGLYKLSFRIAAKNATNSLRAKFGGVDATGAFSFPGTGDYQAWSTFTTTVSLPPGQQILRIEPLSSAFNLNWIELEPVETGLIASGTYQIVNCNSNLTMGVPLTSNSNGAKIVQSVYRGETNNRWVVTHRGANQYSIVNLAFKKGVDVMNYTLWSGNYINLYTLSSSGTGSANQRWIFTPNSDGSYRILSANSGLAIGVSGSSESEGAILMQSEYKEAESQKWMLNTPYATWKMLMFSSAQLSEPSISGDNAAPAGDGISNLMKYALNLNAWSDETSGLPFSGFYTSTSQDRYPSLTYTRPIDAPDITYTVEVSSDLMIWNSGSIYTTAVSTTNNSDGVTQTICIRDLIPIKDANARFIRLKVSKP